MGVDMYRALKALGLIEAMMFSISVAAPSALAKPAPLVAESYPATLTGTQVGTSTLSIASGVRVVSCTTATVTGTIAGDADPVTLTPTYGGCTAAPGGLPTTVRTNGCDYLLSGTNPGQHRPWRRNRCAVDDDQLPGGQQDRSPHLRKRRETHQRHAALHIRHRRTEIPPPGHIPQPSRPSL